VNEDLGLADLPAAIDGDELWLIAAPPSVELDKLPVAIQEHADVL
jgi:hypothetical protein